MSCNLVILVKISFICFVLGNQKYSQNNADLRIHSPSAKQNGDQFQNVDVGIFGNAHNMTTVKITVFYESLCPGSIMYFTSILRPTVEKLAQYLNVHLVPYGFADFRWNRYKRQIQFRCQHGRLECYGNKVHACAMDVLQNMTTAVLYNSCLMEHVGFHTSGSEYVFKKASKKCGPKLGINRPRRRRIFTCAGSSRGSNLMKTYGEETVSFKPDYLPYVLVNNVTLESHLPWKICSLLQPPPPACDYFILQQLVLSSSKKTGKS